MAYEFWIKDALRCFDELNESSKLFLKSPREEEVRVASVVGDPSSIALNFHPSYAQFVGRV